MALMTMTIDANGDGVHHWQQWIAIRSNFVAIGDNGANGEMSDSLDSIGTVLDTTDITFTGHFHYW